MEAQRVVQAISTILPKIESRFGPPPVRYMREQEASLLASVCEEWLRTVAAEEWSSEILGALPEVTTACLNALTLAMMNAGNNTSSPSLGHYDQHMNNQPHPPPTSSSSSRQHQGYQSTQPSPHQQQSPYHQDHHRDFHHPDSPYVHGAPPLSPSQGVGDLPPGSLELVQVLKHNFGNRATELLGVLSVTGGSNNISRSSEKKRFLTARDLHLGLSQLGFEISLQNLTPILEALLGKSEPLYLHDFDMILNLGANGRPTTSSTVNSSDLHSIPSPYSKDDRRVQEELEHHQLNLMRVEPLSPQRYQQSVNVVHEPEYDAYGFHVPHQNPYGTSQATHRPKLSPRIAAVARSSNTLDVGGEDTPAPELAKLLAQRLQEYGIGLESCFEALNVSGASSGVKPSDMVVQLESVFNIKCPEEVANRLVAWGDISGDGRLRYMEFARLIRSATGYTQVPDLEGEPSLPPSAHGNYSTNPSPYQDEPYNDTYGYHNNTFPSHPSSSRGGGSKSHKQLIEEISETCYFAAQETQSCGGVGMRAVFKSAAAREDKNPGKDNKLSPSALSEYLQARGCSISESDLERCMVKYGEGGPLLSFSQFMRMMATASPAR